MLTIIKRMTAVLARPKYYPQSRHAQWCVYDTDKKITVYGPETRSACQRYIDEEQSMSQNNTIGASSSDQEDGIIEFPLLMQNPDSKTIFLITGQKSTGAYKGFLLADGTPKPSQMGRQSDHWKKSLVPFTGSITLSNNPS